MDGGDIMFYKIINSELISANEVYNASYYLHEGNKQEIDGWKWFNTSEEAVAMTRYISPTNPANLTSNDFKMFGLGNQVYITPMITSNLKIDIKFIPSGVGEFGVNQYKLAYGSGTPPVNGASAAGTVIGGTDQGGSALDASYTPTPIVRNAVVTGLTLGVQYWFDIQAAKFPNNSIVGVQGIEVVLEEMQI